MSYRLKHEYSPLVLKRLVGEERCFVVACADGELSRLGINMKGVLFNPVSGQNHRQRQAF